MIFDGMNFVRGEYLIIHKCSYRYIVMYIASYIFFVQMMLILLSPLDKNQLIASYITIAS